MKYLTRMLAFTRLMTLRRHWKALREILYRLSVEQEATLATLVFGEALRAARHPMPQFYGCETLQSYQPWGDTAERAFREARDEDPRWAYKGIATWLAVVYHETRNAPLTGLQALHKEVGHDFERLRALHERILAVRQAA
jgi:hypothetical protein